MHRDVARVFRQRSALHRLRLLVLWLGRGLWNSPNPAGSAPSLKPQSFSGPPPETWQNSENRTPNYESTWRLVWWEAELTAKQKPSDFSRRLAKLLSPSPTTFPIARGRYLAGSTYRQ